MSEHEAVNFDKDLLDELSSFETPVAGGGNFTSFGRIWMSDLAVKSYDESKGGYVKRDYKPGTPIKSGEWIAYTLHQDCKELNDTMYDKFWFIEEKVSGKRKKTHFGEIILPSIEAVFGGKKEYYKALGKKAYAAIEDFATDETRTSKKDGKDYPVTAPKFVAVFKSKAECETARAERFTRKENGTLDLNDASDIPHETIVEARGLIQAVGLEQARTILSNTAPYNMYDLEKLIEVANPL